MPSPPSAERRPHIRNLHGETVEDPYFWLRDREDPAVIEYLEANNAYTAAMMEDTSDLQQEIFEEIKARTQETDIEVPARRGDYFYATRTEEGKDYRIWIRMAGAPDGTEEVLLDENIEASGHDYFRLGNLAVSPDARLVAYTTDTDGSERFRLRFRDMDSGRDLSDEIPLCSYSLAWSSDSRHIFYTVPNEAMRPWQVWCHRIGEDSSDDRLVLQEDDEGFYLGAQRSRSGGFVFLGSGSATTTEVWAIPADAPGTEPRSVLGRTSGIEYTVDHRGADFWIVTNHDALDGRVITIPVEGGEATEVVAHEHGTRWLHADCFADHVVVWGRKAGLPAALVLVEGRAPTVLDMPEAVYHVAPGENYEFETSVLRYRYQSPVTSPSVIDHDVRSGERTLLKQTPVLGGYHPSDYRALLEWAPGAGGASIPVTIVYRRDTPMDGTAPIVIYAYGAYELSRPAAFSIARLSLLDRGVVYAIAHVRGGGEMGRSWYEAGKMEHKRNTFTDLIDVAGHLVAAGYGSSGRIAIHGGSAGGLTVGAAMAMRPDLFRVVLASVPFVDVVNTMLDAELPLTVAEWEEWGNPQIEEQYRWIRSYSPYENVVEAELPSVLVTAGFNDPRVGYWEPAKWVAKLRLASTSSNPILLKTEMGAGHYARSGRYDVWRDEAFNLAFILRELGVEPS